MANVANKHLPRTRTHAVLLLSRHCRFHFAVTTQTMFLVDLRSHTVAYVSRNAHWRVRLR